MNHSNNIKTKSFLRWAGGKTWFTKYIELFLPDSFNNYFEPFLGGGSIYFFLKSQGYIKNKSYLADSNKDLINTYRVIKSQPQDLINLLKSQKDNESEYYKIRNEVFDNPIERAAQFLFLNKTSFNGIHRVNSKGKYNVPYGRRNLVTLYDFDHLFEISNLLHKAYFSASDFKDSCQKAQTNDFIFIDPPYTVAHENNGFIQYNQSIFSWQNQIELSKITKSYTSKKIHFIVTNAYHSSIKQLYAHGTQVPISRSSTIGGVGAKRTQYKELIITNLL